MADEPAAAPTNGAAPAAPIAAAPTPAVPASLLTTETPAAPAVLTTEQVAAKAESTARTEAFAKAEGKDPKIAAYTALTADEKTAAFKDMPEAVRKELGIEDPAIPIYGEFKMPEGMKIDPAAIEGATKIFKDARLSPEHAQQLITFAAEREAAAAKAGVQAFVELQNKWVSEIKADPDIGGGRLNASLAAAARAIDRLAVPGLKEALTLTGAGNNPAIVKAFVRLGQMISEDRFEPGSQAPPGVPLTPAEKMYPGGPKQSAE